MAAKEMGLDAVPTLRLSHFSPEERRAYVLADNKLTLNASWESEILAIEPQALIDLDFDATLISIPPNFLRHVQNVASEMPRLRHSSGADNPAWCSFKMPMICSSLYRLFSISVSLV